MTAKKTATRPAAARAKPVPAKKLAAVGGTAGTASAATSGRKPRQDRGERRRREILDAAEKVIAKVGVEAATTNAIAARAGAGMGSLYHFFADKEEIVQALADRYVETMRPLAEYDARPELKTLPLARMVDGVIDPLVEFFRKTPAYWHVFHATASCGVATPCHSMLQETVVRQAESLIAARAPHTPARQRRVQAMVEVELVNALLVFAFSAPASYRATIIDETKKLLTLHAEMIERGDNPLERLR